jgi:hypothetical protein
MLRPRGDYVTLRKQVTRIELKQEKYVLQMCTLHIKQHVMDRACITDRREEK